ncbi:class I SAM-dependent methyltransferase [Cellvibrio japonicus]|uniref:Cyclopropane-fatty-acyl-phospholipid synthase n=1 Tax=Cellvibrio japonicus (strain Ueda107) TaxID=498211 RepID=B3PFF1_CELJU|nr:class I SAM-dependent methyltransferase [Cellvibrio japonicus]ACE83839.1 Cyclopropane-fatty-acyl-phospholipid synthase [Cellvibrio japonicus Ueda107]QEI10823.1 class I SAM-dependent methyltransferase [Cellvibrio japonicus]QEI14399.1 class I SAM-dependent methyltransferase [Cellvibrio japonicus]QEI17977.1 class I SAM-dependent methyltransferase [Cellvibrio japonicus]
MLTINFRDFPLSAGDRVLDLGCGEGRHAINVYLQERVLSIGVDLNLRDLRTAQARAQPFLQADRPHQLIFKQADATGLPFADGSFDKIICSEVLEHIADYHAVLREVARVLKPGGLLAITVPRAWPEKICWWLSDEYHQVEGGHIRIFNGHHLRDEIKQQGFHYYRRHWAHALHSPFWWLKCLFWKTQDTNPLIKTYHRMLVWDLMEKPWLTQTLEKILNPIMGKSLVMYFTKGTTTALRKNTQGEDSP